MQNRWPQYVYLALALAYGSGPLRAQGNVVQEVRGEIRKGSATLFRGFMVQLDSVGSVGESVRTDVQTDGSFRFLGVPAGEYRVRITDYGGNLVQQEFATISPQTPLVTVQLAEQDGPRPPDGSVSLGRLAHPPAPKALKAFSASQKLSEEGKYERAASKLQEALRISPDFSEAWTNLAAQHIRLRQFDKAMSESARALEIAGPNSVDLCNLAFAQWAEHRNSDALQSALQGAELDPSSPKAQYIAGALLVDAHRWSESIPHLRYAARTMAAARQMLEHMREKPAP